MQPGFHGEAFIINIAIGLAVLLSAGTVYPDDTSTEPEQPHLGQTFKINTSSMRPALLEGDTVLVDDAIYRQQDPQRGDIVILQDEALPKKTYVQRIAGLPKESVEIRNGMLFINGKALPESEMWEEIFYLNRGFYGAVGQIVPIPANNYYVLADNSTSGRDSRFRGPIPRKHLIGKVCAIYSPPERAQLLQ